MSALIFNSNNFLNRIRIILKNLQRFFPENIDYFQVDLKNTDNPCFYHNYCELYNILYH